MTEKQESNGHQTGSMTQSSTVIGSPDDRTETYQDWTAERMGNAIPVTPPAPDFRRRDVEVSPRDVNWPATFVPPYIGTPPYEAMCKIFFRRAGVDLVASGWIVTGNTGRKGIITAGHVVYDQGQWSSNYYVLRQYSDGTWAEAFRSNFARTLHGWIHATGVRTFWDIGAIIPDEAISDLTPALPIAYGYNPTQQPFNFFTDAGYPAKPANGYNFDGKYLWVSAGPLRDLQRHNDQYVLEAYNAMEQGSSGSPWLVHDASSNRFYASGVQSCGWDGVPSSYSPYFDDRNIVALLRDIGVIG